MLKLGLNRLAPQQFKVVLDGNNFGSKYKFSDRAAVCDISVVNLATVVGIAPDRVKTLVFQHIAVGMSDHRQQSEAM